MEANLGVHHLLLDGELVALVDVACRAMDLERIVAGPERNSDLLVLLQVGQRLLEELVGDVDRLLVDDGLHADGGSVGRPVGRRRAQDHVLGRFDSSLTSWVMAAMVASFLASFRCG